MNIFDDDSLHAQCYQLTHRQDATAICKRNNYSGNTVPGRDFLQPIHSAQNRVTEDRPRLNIFFVNQSGQMDIQVAPPGELARNGDGRLTAAQNQNAMLRRRRTPGMVEQKPAAENEGARNPHAHKEDAAPQEERRKYKINDPQNQTRNSDRLTNVDDLSASAPGIRKAVKVAIVKTDLNCDYYDQDLFAEIRQLDKVVKFGNIP